MTVNVCFQLNINMSPSFSSPVVQVSYQVEVEFLESVNIELTKMSEQPSIPLSWSFPIIILPHPPRRSAKGEMLACLESSMYSLHQEI